MTDKNYKNTDTIIESIALTHVQVPVNLTFSYGKTTYFNLIIIKITTNNGIEGLGEGLIHPDGVWEQWISSWPKKLIGQDILCLDNLLPPSNTHNERAVCEAFSIALHDAAAKTASIPFYSFLGGKRNTEVSVMACMFPENPDQASELARKYTEQDVKALKVKLIGDFSEDLNRIKAIRDVASSEILLQGDANEGYKSIEDAQEAVLAFGDAGLDIFEDPLKGTPKDYCLLRKNLAGKGAKIMVDILTRKLSDLVDVIRNESADILNFHASEMGSITSLFQRIHLAESFNLPFLIGGTGFAAVGSAAYQHITAAVSTKFPAGELGGYIDHGMPKPLVQKPLLESLPNVKIPNTPGLGVSLDNSALSEFTVKTLCW
ncbi:MAG: mandelate racemase/muconate lactonizing enzyme family protein [Sedimentisphaeraceae bacterium JB056]